MSKRIWLLVVPIAFVASLGNITKDELMELLAYRYGTDKSHDDHKYVDVYETIFQHRRHMVRNLTEIGVAAGRSLQVWNEYFSKAQIQGIDLRFEAAVVRNLSPLRRVKLHICDVLSSENVRTLNFAKESMDVIIDDGPHERSNQEITLANFWTYLKPGGVYIIEDVDAQRGGLDFEENPDKLASFTKSVFAENHVFWVDTAIGHRAWEK